MNLTINKSPDVILCSIFVFVTILVPTVLPFKSILSLLLSFLAIVYLTIEGKVRYDKITVILQFALLSPFLSMLINGASYNTNIVSTFIPLIYIMSGSIFLYFIFSRVFDNQRKIEKLLSLYTKLCLILACILILEAFGYAFYKDVVGIVSINEGDIANAYNFSNKLNATSILDIYFKRPYGPFRYQLIAGYVLMPSFIFLLYRLLSKKDGIISYSIALLLVSIAIFMTSKGVLVASVLISGFLIDYKRLSFFLRMVFKIVYISLAMILLSLLIIFPLVYGFEFGSLLERVSRITLAISVFLNNNFMTLIIGEGLGYTWYGNQYFEAKYYGAVADIGFYVNYLIQGGLTYFMAISIYVFSIIFKFYNANKGSLIKTIYGMLAINTIVWITISNMDLIYLVFILHAMVYSLEVEQRKLKTSSDLKG